MGNMENTRIKTTEDHQPQVLINLLPIQPSTGCHQDHDSSGIPDFIHQVEEHVAYVDYETQLHKRPGRLMS